MQISKVLWNPIFFIEKPSTPLFDQRKPLIQVVVECALKWKKCLSELERDQVRKIAVQAARPGASACIDPRGGGARVPECTATTLTDARGAGALFFFAGWLASSLFNGEGANSTLFLDAEIELNRIGCRPERDF